tara:strand:- start:305 stop:484 length:180 start_codon:yes stop_codon:yes gene_type:complete
MEKRFTPYYGSYPENLWVHHSKKCERCAKYFDICHHTEYPHFAKHMNDEADFRFNQITA